MFAFSHVFAKRGLPKALMRGGAPPDCIVLSSGTGGTVPGGGARSGADGEVPSGSLLGCGCGYFWKPMDQTPWYNTRELRTAVAVQQSLDTPLREFGLILVTSGSLALNELPRGTALFGESTDPAPQPPAFEVELGGGDSGASCCGGCRGARSTRRTPAPRGHGPWRR